MFYILARELDSGNCLPTEQEVLGSISALPWSFSVKDKYSMVRADWVFLYVSIFCLYFVLCCFRRRPMRSADHNSEAPFNFVPVHMYSPE